MTTSFYHNIKYLRWATIISISELLLIILSVPLTPSLQSPSAAPQSQILSGRLRSRFRSQFFKVPRRPSRHNRNVPFCSSRCRWAARCCRSRLRFKWRGRRPMRFLPCHSWCRCGWATWCNTLKFYTFRSWSSGSCLLPLCSLRWLHTPVRSSSGSRHPIGSSSLSSSNTPARRRIASAKRNMMPCTVDLESYRILLRLHPLSGIIAVLISNALSNPSSAHIAAKPLPLLYTTLDLSGSNPLLNWKPTLYSHSLNSKSPCSASSQGKALSMEAKSASHSTRLGKQPSCASKDRFIWTSPLLWIFVEPVWVLILHSFLSTLDNCCRLLSLL